MGFEYSPSLTSDCTLVETKVQKGIRTTNGFSQPTVYTAAQKSVFEQEFYTNQETIINIIYNTSLTTMNQKP